MDNTVPGDNYELETTCELSDKHRNYKCVRRTVAGTLAFILSGLMVFLTALFLYVIKKVNYDHEYAHATDASDLNILICSCYNVMHNARY